MVKEKIETAKAPAAIGPYSQAVRSGGFVFSSGQLALDAADGTKPLPETAAEQAKVALANLSAVLAAAGCTMADVVKTTVFLTDMADFPAVNEVYSSFFPAPAPARSCVAVAALPRGAKVEIEAVAACE